MAEQTGTIKSITKSTVTSKDGGKTYDKAEVILAFTTGQGEYIQNQEVPFTFFGKPAAAVNSFAEGESVKIQYDLKGKQYKGKHYPEISGWKIEANGARQPQQTTTQQDPPF